MLLVYHKKLPKGISLGKHLEEQADGYFVCQYLGKSYYISLTKEMKKLFKIKRKGEILCFDDKELRSESRFEDMVRTIIACVRVQIQDTIGVEIREEMMREVRDRIDNILVPQMDKKIEEKFEQKAKLLE